MSDAPTQRDPTLDLPANTFVTPLLIGAPEEIIPLAGGVSIRKTVPIDFDSLKGWAPLIGKGWIFYRTCPT